MKQRRFWMCIMGLVVGLGSIDGAATAQEKKSKTKAARLGKRTDFSFSNELKETEDIQQKVEEGPSVKGTDVSRRYGSVLDDKIDEEIALAEQVLGLETQCDVNGPVQFRLADLYWEKSKRAFFMSEDFDSTKQQRQNAKAQMREYQQRSVDAYRRLLVDCEPYKDLAEVEYPRMLYTLGTTLIELEQGAEAARLFNRVTKDHPKSEWTPRSWFMIGEYFFNELEDPKKAYRAYAKAVAYKSSPIVPYAIYKQGWCHLNNADYVKARKAFRRVLELSQRVDDEIGEGARRSLRKGALKDYVKAFSYVGAPKEAYSDFVSLGGKKEAPFMMERLGAIYSRNSLYRDVVVVYNALLNAHPTHPRSVVFRGLLLDAFSNLQNDKQVLAQSAKLTEDFKRTRQTSQREELTDERKKEFTKALREGERIAENTLRRLATSFHENGSKLPAGQKNRARAFRIAEALYGHYLDIFPKPNPKAAVNYVFYMQFYLGDVLFEREKFKDAAEAFERSITLHPNPTRAKEKKMLERAAEDAVRAYIELVSDMDRANPPAFKGKEPKKIPPIKQKLIAACQRYIELVGEKGAQIIKVRYTIARVYFQYLHFAKAAPAFNAIVTNHPDAENACDAANLTLDIYLERKNYRALRDNARAYAKNSKLACKQKSRDRFGQLERAGDFNVVRTELEEKGYYPKACDGYEKYFNTYGAQDKYAVRALYNASLMCERAGLIERADKLRERLIQKFSGTSTEKNDIALVKKLVLATAAKLEQLAEFNKAATYYQRFFDLFPSDAKAKTSLFNAAYFMFSIGRYKDAIGLQNAYLKKYGASKEAADVEFARCVSMEEQGFALRAQKSRSAVSQLDAADRCFIKYLRQQRKSLSEARTCDVQVRRQRIMTAVKNKRGAEKQKAYILQEWDKKWSRVKKAGRMTECRRYVAASRFEALEKDFESYKGLRIAALNPARKKQFDKSMKAKAKAQNKLLERYLDVLKIGDPVYSLRACYQRGEVIRLRKKAIEEAPIPNRIPNYKLTEQDKAQLRAKLTELAEPLRADGARAYSTCIDTSEQLVVYIPAVNQARTRMGKLESKQFVPADAFVPKQSVLLTPELPENGYILQQGDGFRPARLP